MNVYLIDREKRNLSEDFSAYRDLPDHITRVFRDPVRASYNLDMSNQVPYQSREYVNTYTLRQIGFRDTQVSIDEIFTFYAEESLDQDEAFSLLCQRQGYEAGKNGQQIYCQYDRERYTHYFHQYRRGYMRGQDERHSNPRYIQKYTEWRIEISAPKPPEKIFEDSLIDDEGNLKESISN